MKKFNTFNTNEGLFSKSNKKGIDSKIKEGPYKGNQKLGQYSERPNAVPAPQKSLTYSGDLDGSNKHDEYFGIVNIHIDGEGFIKNAIIKDIRSILNRYQGERHIFVDGEEINPYNNGGGMG